MYAFGLVTPVLCVEAGQKLLGGKVEGEPQNLLHQTIISLLPQAKSWEQSIPEALAWADKDPYVLNQLLASLGVSISLTPWPDGTGWGAVAKSEPKIVWQLPGKISEMLVQDNENEQAYQAFSLKTKFKDENGLHQQVEFFGDVMKPVVKITTDSGDIAWIKKCQRNLEGLDLVKMLDGMKKSVIPCPTKYAWTTIPNVGPVTHKQDLTELLGLRIGGSSLVQAKQEVQFKMDRFGAEVKEVSTIAGVLCIPPTYEFDSQFIMFIERPGVSVPLFAAQLYPIDWVKAEAK